MAQTINEVVSQINRSVSLSLAYAKVEHSAVFNLIWNNSNATPEQIFVALGNNAGNLVIAFQKVSNLIKSLDPTYIILEAPKKFTINKDGSVTIIEPESGM